MTPTLALPAAPALARLRDFVDRWLFRLAGPEPAPIVLGQRRVFVLPTRAGLAFAATIVTLLIGSINYGLSLGYALTFLLAGLGVVSILHAFRNLVHLGIEYGRCDPVFCGGVARFPLVLSNRRAQARIALVLTPAVGEPAVVDVAGGASAVVALAVPARRRGWQRPGRIRIETTFPLGLVRAWSVIEPDMRCLVWPSPERNAPPIEAGQAPSDGTSAGAGGSDDFSGLRGHRPSDSPRHVAWKSAARGAALLTKLFAGGGGDTVWLDWDRLDAGLSAEARLSRLAAQVLRARDGGVRFGLRIPGVVLAPQSGAAHVEACLKALALHGESPAR
ncbi:MAG TPA: hypothetical protein DHV08_11795 [Rhodocyclaceae bacterium]|nr:MAG: hypothetical protein AUK49_12505 [Betaproteobacteria bacterium CG2_30_68_42]PIV71875.1 MAG: hypothetical protein COW56_12440 [Rhodocyclales bacterium CG17_big_fil_post_rev_8_21_14_2_50_68_7]PJA58348.1 MAG: hypothetical protein CO164_03010 [Rhodocyclales bacterium CG_4_9_14_3_um_filter_68_10]HCX34156.1 hypothetical protein [Rhodocyclaceae bacterium]